MTLAASVGSGTSLLAGLLDTEFPLKTTKQEFRPAEAPPPTISCTPPLNTFVPHGQDAVPRTPSMPLTSTKPARGTVIDTEARLVQFVRGEKTRPASIEDSKREEAV
jgi:hypothetical protein